MTPKEARQSIEDRKHVSTQICRDRCTKRDLDYDMVLRMVKVLSCIVPSEQCMACFETVFSLLEIERESRGVV